MDPFWTLWIINCILYSAVSAFLLTKEWKKQTDETQQVKRKMSNKADEEFVRQVGELRKKISTAPAELERLRLNRKITKKGRKNRIFLTQEYGTLSGGSLVSYIERKRCDLGKLKRSTERGVKKEESRAINKRFESDPSGVYSLLHKMVARDDENEKP